MTDGPPRIRRYQAADLDDLYRICLQTALNGDDATSLFSDPMLPGQLFAAPYAIFEPSLAWVAEDGTGVGGYVLGALDTLAFEQRLERDWWPALRARYPDPRQLDDAISEPERHALQGIHRPFSADPALVSSYPSHLHIDLLPRLQGRGLGRRLIETLLAALRASGSRGVHLHAALANRRAAGFYRHVGMTELPAAGVRVFAMRLADGTVDSVAASGAMPDPETAAPDPTARRVTPE
jgi:ribosomal protein S18 acetylase RimI-like enzyme